MSEKKPLFGVLAGEPEIIGERCADGGKCHHRCTDTCSRRATCSPLSGSGLLSDWSAPESKDQTPAQDGLLDGIELKADGEANFYWLMRGNRWVAKVQMNGEMLVERQEAILNAMLARPAQTEQQPVAYRACRVIGFRPGMGEVTFYVDGGVPAWMNIGETIYVSDAAPIAQTAPHDALYAPGIAEQLERTDWTPEEALRWYAEGKHFDTVNGRTRIIDSGAIASNALKHLSLPYLEMKGDAELSELRTQAAPQPVSAALADVAAERRRQIDAEGWTPEHDDEHSNGEMALAAACYSRHAICPPQLSDVPATWPWGASWWKPGEPRRMLVKAAALILAEIDRLDRAAARGGAGDE